MTSSRAFGKQTPDIAHVSVLKGRNPRILTLGGVGL
jgi:hypothetical protein